jgi:hypothetical protein
MQEGDENVENCATLFSSQHRLKSFLNSPDSNDSKDNGLQPIADYFPSTTVLFADIAGKMHLCHVVAAILF